MKIDQKVKSLAEDEHTSPPAKQHGGYKWMLSDRLMG